MQKKIHVCKIRKYYLDFEFSIWEIHDDQKRVATNRSIAMPNNLEIAFRNIWVQFIREY